MESFSDDYYNKKIDLELKKKELAEKYGAKFGQAGNLPPELENEWLNHIEQFEQQYKDAKQTTVWEYLGKPDFRKVSDIDLDKIPIELKRLMDYMNENNIALDTLCDVEDRELYRFITEELFVHEIDNMHIEGMMTCFTYEEFHPNAKHDIEMAFDYFFRMTLAKMKNIGGEGYDLLYIDKENFVDSDGKNPGKKQVKKRINTFLDTFDYFEVVSNEIMAVNINQEQTDAKLIFDIEYKGCFNNSPECITYKGRGNFWLKPSKYGGWSIYRIDMPGLQV